MSALGATFTDWQQVDAERRPLMDEDFSWSEPPARARRETPKRSVHRRRPERGLGRERETGLGLGREREYEGDQEPRRDRELGREQEPWAEVAARAAATDLELDRTRERWDEASAQLAAPDDLPDRDQLFDPDDVASYSHARVVEDVSGAFDLSDPGRRTVVITGRGDDRYMPALTRRRASELRFHERAGFSPDRTALWAVVLAFAVLVGCFAH